MNTITITVSVSLNVIAMPKANLSDPLTYIKKTENPFYCIKRHLNKINANGNIFSNPNNAYTFHIGQTNNRRIGYFNFDSTKHTLYAYIVEREIVYTVPDIIDPNSITDYEKFISFTKLASTSSSITTSKAKIKYVLLNEYSFDDIIPTK